MPRHLLTRAGQQHPQILHARPHAAIVEIDEVGAVVGVQHVAGMAIAVQADDGDVAGAPVARAHAVERLIGNAGPHRAQFRREEGALQEPVARNLAEAVDIERRPMRECAAPTDRVNAAEKAPHPFQYLGVVEFGCASAAARTQAESIAGEFVQGLAADGEWRDHRDFALRQFQGEGVFLENLRIAPAPRTIELGNDGFILFNADLVDPVFVTVERQHPAIDTKTGAFDGIEQHIRRQIRIGFGILGHGTL